MIYVRNLELVDEYDNTIMKYKNVPAGPCLSKCMEVINKKDGNKATNNIVKKFLYDLDKEFKEYFNMKKRIL